MNDGGTGGLANRNGLWGCCGLKGWFERGFGGSERGMENKANKGYRR